jgi:serine/threonine-protein kinase
VALTVHDPVVGRVLDGRYRIVDRIASGGMATVYRGIDVRLDRPVAVKLLHAGFAADPGAVARFQREAWAAARLSHPDVVAIFDQGTDGGESFLVMEYVGGGTLRDILRARGRLTPDEAVAVMDHVLAALGAAQQEGLIHRDIKPENVLVTVDGRVKVADFGLARAAGGSTLTATGSVLFGTAAYLSPEQWRGESVDARSDLYAAGILFFELLTGSVPYAGDSPHVVMRRHLEEEVPPPSSLAPGLAAEFDELVAWATQRRPADRPTDAAQWHAALLGASQRLGLTPVVPSVPVDVTRQFAPEEAVPVTGATAKATGRVPTTPATGGLRTRRRRWPLVALLVLALTAGAAALGWWLAIGRFVHPPDVVGMPRARAVAALSSAGLSAHFEPARFSSSVPRGQVVAESPTAAGRVSKGGTVDLALSKGPQLFALPSVAGQTRAQATTTLTHDGLKVIVGPGAYSPTLAKGLVVRTDPASSTQVQSGQTVTLVLSRGPAPAPVPNVVDKPLQEAETQLSDQNFRYHVTQAYSDTVQAGSVVSTLPATGTAAAYHSVISIVESKGPQLFPVPSVVRDSIGEAIATLRRDGFTPKPREVFPGGPGIVLHQSPSGGSEEPHGTDVELDYY